MKYYTRHGIEIDPNGPDVRAITRRTKDAMTITRRVRCGKCDGAGYIQCYSFIVNGVCFACGGSGKVTAKDRVYTAEKNAKLDRARDVRNAEKTAARNAESSRLEVERAAKFAHVLASNGSLFEKYGRLESQTSFIADVMFKVWRFADPTPRQLEAVEQAIDRALTEQAAAATAADVIEGRIEIRGVIVSTKSVESAYGTQFKMLVRDDRGFKVWGSIPNSILPISELRDERIHFVATVERSRDDSKFGFFKRPTKANLDRWEAEN
jgi:hypothetical protein